MLRNTASLPTRGNINIRIFLRSRLTVTIHGTINLVGIHYNCQTIKFDAETNGFSLSLEMFLEQNEHRFFKNQETDNSFIRFLLFELDERARMTSEID